MNYVQIGIKTLAACGLLAVLIGCGTTSLTTGRIDRQGNVNNKYVNPSAMSRTATTETESYDIKGACAKMVGGILKNPMIVNQPRPPHIVIDAKYFHNQSATRFNMNLLVDQFRADLINAAQGRLIFVSREAAGLMAEERDLKEAGETGQGATPAADKALGADYRLQGKLTDQPIVDASGAKLDRYTQFLFELVDVQTGQILFSDYYDFKKEMLIPGAYR